MIILDTLVAISGVVSIVSDIYTAGSIRCVSVHSLH